MAAAMQLSRVLCSSPGPAEPDCSASSPTVDAPPPPPRHEREQEQSLSCSQATTDPPIFKMVPDNKRKRSHGTSATQKLQRQEHAAYESRVHNLTLDVNDLRQQIQQLMEFRDIHSMRLLLSNQRFEGDVLKLTRTLLDGICSNTNGLTPSARGIFLSRTHVTQQDPEASGGVYQFVMQRGPPALKNRDVTINSIRVLALADCTTTGEAGTEIQRVCGNDGGCAVEVIASLTGDISRDKVVALFPGIIGDEVQVARIVGLRIKFSSRLLVYFNPERRVMQLVAQADIVAALRALHLGESSDFAELSVGTEEPEDSSK